MTTNIEIASDLNVGGNLTVDGQLNLYDMILASPTIGFSLYGNDSQGYPTINFFTGNPSTGTLQYSIGVFNDIFYIIPNGGSQALQVNSSNDVNMPYSVSVCGGNGTFTCDGAATFNDTLTANTIQPTANDTGSLGSSSLNYATAYINKAYLGYIETLVYMQNGASFYGPLNILDPSGDSIFTITVNSSNQLQIASSGETNPILVSDTSNNVNFPGNLSVGGTINPNVSQTTIAAPISGSMICSMPFQGSSYKKVVIFFDEYANSGAGQGTTSVTYTFPTAFTNVPVVTANTITYTTLIQPTGTITTTDITFTIEEGSVLNGFLIIEGY